MDQTDSLAQRILSAASAVNKLEENSLTAAVLKLPLWDREHADNRCLQAQADRYIKAVRDLLDILFLAMHPEGYMWLHIQDNLLWINERPANGKTVEQIAYHNVVEALGLTQYAQAQANLETSVGTICVHWSPTENNKLWITPDQDLHVFVSGDTAETLMFNGYVITSDIDAEKADNADKNKTSPIALKRDALRDFAELIGVVNKRMKMFEFANMPGRILAHAQAAGWYLKDEYVISCPEWNTGFTQRQHEMLYLLSKRPFATVPVSFGSSITGLNLAQALDQVIQQIDNNDKARAIIVSSQDFFGGSVHKNFQTIIF